MKKVGLWLNSSKEEIQQLTSELTSWLSDRQWEVLADGSEMENQDISFIISLGGDGTLLKAAREAAAMRIPVLGVNLGRLGFLCEIEKDKLFVSLEKVLSGDYLIEERLMLNAVLKSPNKEDKSVTVLNDVVFSRESDEGIITIKVNLSGEPALSYPADGLIVATPTGSTAYSLSAGGPIVSPNVEAIIITPIATHSLSARPMVVSDHEVIEVVVDQGRTCNVTFDGRGKTTLLSGESAIITKAPLKALLIRLGSRSFSAVIREKLRDR
ncbi:MAG TPA: NAD(+)/NADH kinase [Desulfitobacteriaceae bacterium]|nr:NAD(+)/NADH kinase [Desulfitobacteriaceae bacterium]